MSEETQVSPEEPERTQVSRRKFLGGVAGAGIGGLALAGILAACGDDSEESGGGGGDEPSSTTAPGQTAADTSQPIVIGSPYPTTGPSAGDGQEMSGGSDLAIQEINDSGGIAGRTIEHLIVDTNVFDGESITAAFNQFVTEEVDAIAVGYITVFEPNDITIPYPVPYLNASTSVDQVAKMKSDPEAYRHIFQADPTNEWYGRGFPPFLESLIAKGLFNPPTKTIHILEGDSPYSTGISQFAQEAAPDYGWEIVGVEPVLTGVTDWAPQIQKVKETSPAVVFTTHWVPAELAALMNQWAADPGDSFLYLQYGASVPEFLEIAGDAAEGVVWATVLGTMNDAVGLAFQERFQAQWGRAAGFSNAGTGYDEVYMLSRAWGKTGDPRNFEANVAELRKMIHRGVSGGYWFEHDPDANYCLAYPPEIPDSSLGNPHLFFQVQRGEDGNLAHTIIEPAPYIQAEYVRPPWLSF